MTYGKYFSSKTNIGLQNSVLYLAVFIMTVFLMMEGSFLLIPLVFAGLLAMIMTPIEKSIYKKIKVKFLSIIISFLMLVIPLTALFYLFSYQIVEIFNEFGSIEEKTIEGLEKAQNSLTETLPQSISEKLSEKAGSALGSVADFIGTGLVDTSTFIFNVALVFLYSYFFLLYRGVIKNFLYHNITSLSKTELKTTINQISEMLTSYVSGLGLVILILSLLNFVGLYFIGVEYAIFWGVFSGILATIPYVGTIIGGVFPFLYCLATYEHEWQPVAVIIYITLVQQIEGNLITPKVVGDKVNINPLIALISLVLFGFIWGLAGIFLALPLTSLIRIIFSQFGKTYPISVLMSAKIEKDKGDITWKKEEISETLEIA